MTLINVVPFSYTSAWLTLHTRFFSWGTLARYASFEWRKTAGEIRLKADNAILAEEKHIGMYALAHCFSSFESKFIPPSSYDELVNEYQVTYLAGGAAQNAARGAAVS